MSKTHVLKVGDSLTASGTVTVTVLKCGMHSEGGAPAEPTVTLVVDDDAPPSESDQVQSEEVSADKPISPADATTANEADQQPPETPETK